MKAGSNNSPTAGGTAGGTNGNNGTTGGSNSVQVHGTNGANNTPTPNSNQGPAPPNTTIGHYIIGKRVAFWLINRAVREGAGKRHVRLSQTGDTHPHRGEGNRWVAYIVHRLL